MAVIVLAKPTLSEIGNSKSGATLTIRDATAQANTGQTDWIRVPQWAVDMVVYLSVTAVVGTTPLTDFKLSETDPVRLNDSNAIDFADWNGVTQIAGTTAGNVIVAVGPGITGIADDDAGAYYKVNGILPAVLGFVVTFDRTTGDETYTYTVRAHFKSRS